MNQPPGPPDPNGLTQPIPTVGPPSAQPGPAQPPRTAPPPRTPYVPVFGNLGAYLLARLVALGIDVFVVAFAIACFAFTAYDHGALAFAPRTPAGFAAIAGIAFGGALLFAILCEALTSSTLGKGLFGLGVRRNDGRHPGLQRIVARYVFLPLDLVLIGPLLALATPRHRRIGDFVAGTVVARNRIGAFASVVSVVLLGALAYAVFAFGGGLNAALTVVAESAYFGPPLAVSAVQKLGFAVPGGAVPAAMPGAATATLAPSSASSPEVAPSSAAEPTVAPVSSDAPAASFPTVAPAASDGAQATPVPATSAAANGPA